MNSKPLDLHTTTWFNEPKEYTTSDYCRAECPHRLIDCSDINKEYYWQCEWYNWKHNSIE